MNARTRAALCLACAAAALALAAPTRLAAQAQTPAPAAATETVKDLPLTAEQRQACVGTYEATGPDGQKVSMRVFEENGVLRGLPSNRDQSESRRLLYQGDNVFQPEGMPRFVMTFTIADGKATKFSFGREGQTFDALRVQ
jgi:hypothetical protein